MLGSMLLVIGGVPPATAADAPSREYPIKAAFIYNFVQFVQWPGEAFAAPEDPLVIAVYGQDPFNGALEQAVAGKRVEGHALVVRHFATLEDVGACHVLFISSADADQFPAVRQRLGAHAPVLTIGEAERFPWDGGIIRFIMQNNKVHFEVNLDAANAAGLKISSKLLRLARIFNGGGNHPSSDGPESTEPAARPADGPPSQE